MKMVTRQMMVMVLGLMCLFMTAGRPLEYVDEEMQLCIPFIENMGQYPDQVRYIAQTFGGTVFVNQSNEIIYALPVTVSEKGGKHLIGSALKECFASSSECQPVGEGISPVRINRFGGTGRHNGAVSAFHRVSFGELFPGIDVKLRAYANNVEKLFYVSPEGEVEDILMTFEGQQALSINTNGELIVSTDLGDVSFTQPVAYQDIDGQRSTVDVAYHIEDESYGFIVGEYDEDHLLVIDPLLASTYVGGSGKDEDYEPLIAIGPYGNVFYSGSSFSANYPTTTGAYALDRTGTSDRVISKFSPDLSTLIASTFIGGSGEETGQGLCFDQDGNVYAAGYTQSPDFPVTQGAYDQSYNGGFSDAFVVKLDNDLTTLLASTYYGGSDGECFQSPRIDIVSADDGSVYVAGLTNSTNLPMSASSADASYGGGGWQDCFVARFSSDLSALLGSSYVGGNTDEWRPNIQLDGEGNVFVAGSTREGFPTTEGAFGESYFGDFYDMFIMKLSADLSTILASTYLGSNGSEDCIGLAVDNSGAVYAIGYTTSAQFPVSENAYDKTYNYGSLDMVIAKLDNDLTTVLAGTYLGGSGLDSGQDIALGNDGSVYVIGMTQSKNFPVSDNAFDKALNASFQGLKVCLSQFDSDLSLLKASTYFGGRNEEGKCVIVSSAGDVYISGKSKSSSMPTTETAFDKTYNSGGVDSFIAKFDADLSVGNSPVEMERGMPVPVAFDLKANYPNPFNPSTQIGFELPQSGNVKLSVYDVTGRQVILLKDEYFVAGKHSVEFDAHDLPSGIYYCRMEAQGQQFVQKMTLLK